MIRNHLCICCVIFFIIFVYMYYFQTTPPHMTSTTQDPMMYPAILVKSDTCGFCQKQLDIIEKQGGAQAKERIKILDLTKDKALVDKLIGPVEGVPLWFNPLTGHKSSGLKTYEELKDMGIILE